MKCRQDQEVLVEVGGRPGPRSRWIQVKSERKRFARRAASQAFDLIDPPGALRACHTDVPDVVRRTGATRAIARRKRVGIRERLPSSTRPASRRPPAAAQARNDLAGSPGQPRTAEPARPALAPSRQKLQHRRARASRGFSAQRRQASASFTCAASRNRRRRISRRDVATASSTSRVSL